jgi:glycosyltransferase involved in cell wall biosynthesis
MGFLDAMSYGVPVISPNEPTMNEYITDKKNGYLYDYNNPKNIDLKNIEIVKANLKKYIENNYSKWTNSKEEIYNFIENKKVKKNNLNWLYKIYGIPLEKIIIIKRKIINITKNLF